MDEFAGESYEMRERRWDSDFMRWLAAGMPEPGSRNFTINPKPAKHPQVTHLWNTDEAAFIKQIKKDTEEGKYENRDDIEEY